MCKYVRPLLLFFSFFAGIGALCGLKSRQMPELLPGDSITGEILQKDYALRMVSSKDGSGKETALTCRFHEPDTELCLVLTDIRSYQLYVNGVLADAFEGTPASYRVHVVELTAFIDRSQPEAELNISLHSDGSIAGAKYLLSIYGRVERNMLWALASNMLMLGMYLAIIINCATLYYRKRSENYLLIMIGITLLAMLTVLLYLNYPIRYIPLWDVLHMGYLHGISQVMCLLFCIYMMGIRLGKKGETWLCLGMVLSAMAIIWLLNRYSIRLRHFFLDGILLTAVGVLIWGYAHKKENAALLLTGLSAMEAFYHYYTKTNMGELKPLLPLYYVHLPEFCYLIFILFCMVAVNHIFSGKFYEVDVLAERLTQMNEQLDAKVEERTRELQTANEALIREQEHRHSMMTNIFHDLRSPLFSASGLTEMLHGAGDEDEENLTALKRQLASLTHLTENLFLISRLEEKQITFTEMPIRVDLLCRQIIDEARGAAEKKKIELSCMAEKELTITGDGFRLRQALENVIYNGIRYCSEGCRVSCRILKRQGEAHIMVEDNGPGIAPEDIPNLFERYYTGRRRNKGEGSGLGLSIAMELVKAQGGTITCTSRLSKGTVFDICLPLQDKEKIKK